MDKNIRTNKLSIYLIKEEYADFQIWGHNTYLPTNGMDAGELSVQ
jgi:hypothetical protein